MPKNMSENTKKPLIGPEKLEKIDKIIEDSLESKHKKAKHKKKKSSKKKYRSSDSESDTEVKLLKKLELAREKTKEGKMRNKLLIKALETPEEKRLRRLQKKDAKERKRKQRMGWDPDQLHFTNYDNPYGDCNLMDTFMWKKKIDKDGLGYLPKEEMQARNRSKREQNRLELDKVKKRRLEREKEREEREKLMELEMRQREAAQFSHFNSQEDKFQLEQARIRSQIRIDEDRSKPIDLLAQYVTSNNDVSEIDKLVLEPYKHLNGLTLRDLEDLIEDIKVYQMMENNDENRNYWDDLMIIAYDELRRLKLIEATDATEQRQGIHASIASDVSKVFSNKSASELEKLKKNIQTKLSGPTVGLDVGYWESLLSQISAHQSRARLKERHRANLKLKLEQLKQQQGVNRNSDGESSEQSSDSSEDELDRKEIKSEPGLVPKIEPDLVPKIEPDSETVSAEAGTSKASNSIESDSASRETDTFLSATSVIPAGDESVSKEDETNKTVSREMGEMLTETDKFVLEAIECFNSGRLSPKLISFDCLDPGTDIIDPTEDELRLKSAREKVINKRDDVIDDVKKADGLTAEEKKMKKELEKSVNADDAQFSVEAQLDPKHYLWADKYRPRKPRYFNRVHTGFEWNKYNQTHYDLDNPPPKIVQGYKFNIFYPDLIDKSKTPQYEILQCEDNRDFAILKFTASSPYEDIAFKIVNREWEYSYKRGFRSHFQNNIFQLWFHFKRYRYRR